MGYCTYYTLDLISRNDEALNIFNNDFCEREIKGISCDNVIYNALYKVAPDYYPSDEAVKWYDFSDDFIEISKNYPDILFKVSGEGEERDDIWAYWFKDGKMQGGHAEIIYPEFNEGSWF